MESWKKCAVWKVIDYVEQNDVAAAIPFCKQATGELSEIKGKIKLDQRKQLQLIVTFVDHVRQKQSVPSEKDRVRKLFDNTIKPFLQEEERNHNKLKVDDANKGNQITHDIEDAGEYTGGSSTRELTHRKLERGKTGLVRAFRDIFDGGSWGNAFAQLEPLTKSKSQGIACLLGIVQKASAYNMLEAKKQLTVAEECAHRIVRNDQQLPHVKPNMNPTTPVNEMLQQYRYEHAQLATERLQREVLKLTLDRLKSKYGMQALRESHVCAFVNDCTEITWLMSVEDPPIYLVNDQSSAKVDGNMYELKQDQHANCIVWPALQLNGNVVSKGVAWCK